MELFESNSPTQNTGYAEAYAAMEREAQEKFNAFGFSVLALSPLLVAVTAECEEGEDNTVSFSLEVRVNLGNGEENLKELVLEGECSNELVEIWSLVASKELELQGMGGSFVPALPVNGSATMVRGGFFG